MASKRLRIGGGAVREMRKAVAGPVHEQHPALEVVATGGHDARRGRSAREALAAPPGPRTRTPRAVRRARGDGGRGDAARAVPGSGRPDAGRASAGTSRARRQWRAPRARGHEGEGVDERAHRDVAPSYTAPAGGGYLRQRRTLIIASDEVVRRRRRSRRGRLETGRAARRRATHDDRCPRPGSRRDAPPEATRAARRGRGSA